MDKIDNFLTHYAWVPVIIFGTGWYFFGPLVGLVSAIVVLFAWGMIALSNPKNVVGIIHYHNGKTEKHGIFERYSDYEDWKDTMMRERGDEINYISYELYNEEQ